MASTRSTILTAFKTCLEGITAANGYQETVAEVRRGIHQAQDFQQKPALCFWNDRAPRTDFTGQQALRVLHMWVWGYVAIQPGDYSNLDKLIEDIETRLMTSSAWAYRDDTKIGELQIFEGGVEDPVGIFEMEISVEYEYTMSNP